MDSTLAHGAATREHTDGNGSGSTAAQWTKIPDGNRPKAVPQQTYRENPEEKKSKGVLHQQINNLSCKVFFFLLKLYTIGEWSHH